MKQMIKKIKSMGTQYDTIPVKDVISVAESLLKEEIKHLRTAFINGVINCDDMTDESFDKYIKDNYK